MAKTKSYETDKTSDSLIQRDSLSQHTILGTYIKELGNICLNFTTLIRKTKRVP